MTYPIDRSWKWWLSGAAAAMLLAGGCDIAYDVEASPSPPAASGAYRMDLRGVETPSSPLKGHVAGTPFTLKSVDYHESTTTVLLNSEQGHTVFIFLFLDEGQAPSAGSKIIEQPRDSYDQPHVHAHYPTADGGQQSAIHTSEYVMRLEFGAREGSSFPARLYLCLPDVDESWLTGTFDVPVE